MVISDGQRVVPLATSHDYKRVFDGQKGPNTGGMGSHSPAAGVPAQMSRGIHENVILPTIAGMAAEGREYRGVLYVGLMLTADGPRVLEFNCRLGDPETQSILLRLEDDFATTLRNAADGQLTGSSLRWRREAVTCVVMAAEGYPANPRKGDPISGLDEAHALPGVTVYHAATKIVDERLVTSGGRVLSVCGRGATLAESIETAYRGVEKIHFEGVHYRSDIGADSLAKLGG
jgi:phosphoribosylamine--glycine ligase